MEIFNMNNINKYFNLNSPTSVSVDITKACNLKCVHCYNDSGKKASDELTSAELLKLFEDLATLNIVNVCLCGGEPLCSPIVYDLMRVIKGKCASINMVSNGFLIDEKVINNLVDAGLNVLQISLDGCTAMEHDSFRGVAGSFDAAIRAIKLAREKKLQVLVSCCINKINFKNLEKYLKLCCDLGISSIRFSMLIPIGRCSKSDNLILTTEEFLEAKRIINQSKLNVAIEFSDPIAHIQSIAKMSEIGLENNIVIIKVNGDVGISPFVPISFGNIRNTSLTKLWDEILSKSWTDPKTVNVFSSIETVYDIQNANNII